MTLLRTICASAAIALMAVLPAHADLSSSARVLDDGSLSILGRLVRLHGISIPPTDRLCNAPDMPGACGPRAVLQLSRKIGAEFVHCRDLGRDEVRLYTNAAFASNLAFYARRGYQEYRRGSLLPGSITIFMRKTIDTSARP